MHQAQFFMANIARRAGIEISFAGRSLALQNDGLRSFAFGLYDYDTGGRLYAWQAALELWKNHPVIGVGPGNLEFLSPVIQERMGASFITPSTHNIYLRVLAENGVLGLVSLIVLLVSVLVMAVKAGGDPVDKVVGKEVGKVVGKVVGEARAGRNALLQRRRTIWLSASLIALIANGLFIDSLHFRHLWLVWALALSEVRTD